MPGSKQEGFPTLKVIIHIYWVLILSREFLRGQYKEHIILSETPYDVGTAIIPIFRWEAKAKKKLTWP